MTLQSDGFNQFPGLALNAAGLAQETAGPFREDKMDLRGLAGVLGRRRLSILFTTALFALLGVLFLLVSTPLYTAGVQILVDPRDRRILQTEVTPTALGGDTSLIESQVRLITSDAVLKRVVESEKLAVDPEFGAAPSSDGKKGWFGFSGGREPGDAAQDPGLRALLALQKRVTVRRADKTYIMDVRVSSREAQKAARLADAIAAAFLADQAEADQSTTRRTTAALTSRLEQLRDNLRAAENRAQDFRAANNIVGSQGRLVLEQQLSELNQRLVLARARVSELKARFEQAQRVIASGADPGAIPDALTSTVIQSLRTQAAEITRRESELANQLGPRHPTVLDQRVQSQNIKKLIAEELKRIADASKNEYDASKANAETLAQELDRLSAGNQVTNQAMIRLRELEREVDASRSLYEAFLNRAKQTSEQERLEPVTARVIAPANVPTEPSYPPRLMVLALAIGAGLGFGVSIALFREHFDETVRSGAELRRITGLDLLAAVPKLGTAKKRWLRRGLAAALGFDVIADPRSPLASAMRILRNELRDGPQRTSQRIVVVTSSVEGEGKSTVALNLALAASQHEERVLIIDADLMSGGLSRKVAPNAKAGFLEVLNGGAKLGSVLVRDPRTGLNALPLTAGRLLAGERPARAQLAMLKEQLARDFDYVVVDAGPLLADMSSRALAEFADQIIVVVRAGSTPRDTVVEAINSLRVPRSKLAGLVLNHADPKAAARYNIG